MRKFFTCMALAVLAFGFAPNPALAGDARFPTLHPTTPQHAFFGADPQLVAVFKARHPQRLVAYSLDGPENTVGTYVIGRLPNGDVLWLVTAAVDRPVAPYTLDAVAFVPAGQWTKALADAHKRGYEYPTPARLTPEDRMVSASAGKFNCYGSYFSREKGCAE